MNQLAFIKSVGFRCVGKWHVGDAGLDFAIEREVRSAKKSLYAFVADAQVLYVGKASGTFAGRMSGYRRPGSSQRTNIRINPLIAEMIRTEKQISIYHLQPTEEIRFRSILLNIAAALEEPLIELISPRWNLNGRKKESDEASESTRIVDVR
ncbi:MAG: hypothetical protein Q8M83_05935, partial [bacterium]|nr:hypothetical protein [bacterium]